MNKLALGSGPLQFFSEVPMEWWIQDIFLSFFRTGRFVHSFTVNRLLCTWEHYESKLTPCLAVCPGLSRSLSRDHSYNVPKSVISISKASMTSERLLAPPADEPTMLENKARVAVARVPLQLLQRNPSTSLRPASSAHASFLLCFIRKKNSYYKARQDPKGTIMLKF
jgi:hypothetical protein